MSLSVQNHDQPKSQSPVVRYLAGDIGGTNSRLHLMEVHSASSPRLTEIHNTNNTNNNSRTSESISSDDEILIAEEVYPSQQYASLTFIIHKFLNKYSSTGPYPIACCLAVAGPVRANKSQITNLNWVLDGDQMVQELGIKRVVIINDFVGIGYGLLALNRSDVIPINDVPVTADAPKACLGAGTGLGETYLTYNGREYDVWASEGGHADFAPRDEIEWKLLQYFKLSERVTRVSVERIVSGLGIPKIYEFFCHQHPEEISADVTNRLRAGEDPGAVIAEFAREKKDNLCRLTIDLFVKCYGAEAGNLALKLLPFGGLYIAGGIAPKLQWAIDRDYQFYSEFINKGRMKSLLERVPVFLVIHKQVGLLGAKVVCRRLLRSEGFELKGELTTFPDSQPHNLNLSLELLNPDNNNLEHELHTNKSKNVERVVVRRRKPTDSSPTSGPAFSPAGPAAALSDYSSNSNSSTNSLLLKSAIFGGMIASLATLALATFIQFKFTNNNNNSSTQSAFRSNSK